MAETLAQRVRAGRKRLKFSLSDLAAACCLSKTYLHDLEHERLDNPSLNTLLSRGLGISVEELATGRPLIGSADALAEVSRLRDQLASLRCAVASMVAILREKDEEGNERHSDQ